MLVLYDNDERYSAQPEGVWPPAWPVVALQSIQYGSYVTIITFKIRLTSRHLPELQLSHLKSLREHGRGRPETPDSESSPMTNADTTSSIAGLAKTDALTA